MLGGIVKGIGSALGGTVKGIAGATADVAGISDFTSALGSEKKPKLEDKQKLKPFDEDESPTKILQRILTEIQTIHKVMASQVVPPSEEEEIERDKDKKDEEVLEALEDLRPEEEEKKKKKPWWKILWDWIGPFIKMILNPLTWIKALLALPAIASLVLFASTVVAFFLFNPVGWALLAIGIIAVNWKDIKAAIKRYVGNIKGWVKKAMISIGLGSWVETAEETAARKAEEERAALERQIDAMLTDDRPETTVPSEDLTPVIDADGDGIPDADFAGWYKGGGMIPKGKEGIAGEAGPESVRGQLLGGPTIVKGPARVKREGDLDRDLAMKEGRIGTASAADVDYQPRAILGRDKDLDLAKQGYYPGSEFYHTIQERKAGSSIQHAVEDDYGNIDMGDAEFEAATPRQERSLFRQYMRNGFGGTVEQTTKYALALPAIYPRLKQAFQAEQKAGNIPAPMKEAMQMQDYAKTFNDMGARGKLDWWTGLDFKQDEYDQMTYDGYTFSRFGSWENQGYGDYVDMARGRSYNRGGKDEYEADPEYGRTTGMSTGHNLLSSYIDVNDDGTVELSGESEVKGKKSTYGKYTAKKVKKATAHLATGETKFGMVGGKGQQLLSGWGAAKKVMGDAATITAMEREFNKSLGLGIPGEYKESERTIFGMPYVDENQKRIQATGAMGTLNIINSSNTQNISTASSSSKQNNVGQTQQSISTTDRSPAPRTMPRMV